MINYCRNCNVTLSTAESNSNRNIDKSEVQEKHMNRTENYFRTENNNVSFGITIAIIIM